MYNTILYVGLHTLNLAGSTDEVRASGVAILKESIHKFGHISDSENNMKYDI